MQLGRFAAILVREKDEIRELLGRSPDKGDSVAQTFLSDIPEVVALHETSPREAPDWRY
ncbi:hypothetical protein D3C87_1062890 [compost metagenome]